MARAYVRLHSVAVRTCFVIWRSLVQAPTRVWTSIRNQISRGLYDLFRVILSPLHRTIRCVSCLRRFALARQDDKDLRTEIRSLVPWLFRWLFSCSQIVVAEYVVTTWCTAVFIYMFMSLPFKGLVFSIHGAISSTKQKITHNQLPFVHSGVGYLPSSSILWTLGYRSRSRTPLSS